MANRNSNNRCNVIILVFTLLIICFIINSCFGWQKKYRSVNSSAKYKRRIRGRSYSGPYDENEYYSRGPLQPRLVGGYPAPYQDIPSQVYMLKDDKFHCGGVLVELFQTFFFLTAAHCVWRGSPKPGSPYDPARIKMVGNDINILYKSGHEIVRETQYMVLHEYYDPPTGLNDIAIIFPTRPIYEGGGIHAIPLPRRHYPPPHFVQVSGWGTLVYGGDASHDLQKAVMPTMNIKECEPYAKDYLLSPYEFCVGLRGFDEFLLGPCYGDSGGPAIGYDPYNEEDYLVGVINFGTSLICGNPYAATVVTNTANYVAWMVPHVRDYIAKYGTSVEQKRNETRLNITQG